MTIRITGKDGPIGQALKQETVPHGDMAVGSAGMR